jgi:dTDP-4-amino-4,6-dideoxygalactose transaminase
VQTVDRPTETLEHIPVFVPHTGIDTLKHLTDALDVGWLGMGATTKEFEERIAAFLGLNGRYVVATNTGTSALHIALLTAGVGPGDEVIVPSFNYVADHQAIRYTGADVVMCDIRDDDLGIDCEQARALVTKRTKAIIPLHFAGIPCDQAGVYDLAREFGLRVVEDGCHAFGSTIDGKLIGSYGDIATFSFDPVKIITSIDGGCVVVNTEEELRKLHHLRLLGVDKDTTERYKNSRLGIRRGGSRLPLPSHQHHGERRHFADQEDRRIHPLAPRDLHALQRGVRWTARRARASALLRRRQPLHL